MDSSSGHAVQEKKSRFWVRPLLQSRHREFLLLLEELKDPVPDVLLDVRGTVSTV